MLLLLGSLAAAHPNPPPGECGAAESPDDEQDTDPSKAEQVLQVQYLLRSARFGASHEVSGRNFGPKGAFAGGDLVWSPRQDWTGRAEVGLDLFPRGAFEASVSFVAGAAGHWSEDGTTADAGATAAVQARLGARGERLHLHLRSLSGLDVGPLGGSRSETALTAAWMLLPRLGVVGDLSWRDAGAREPARSAGLGVRAEF